jgi:hypothetical protein
LILCKKYFGGFGKSRKVRVLFLGSVLVNSFFRLLDALLYDLLQYNVSLKHTASLFLPVPVTGEI